MKVGNGSRTPECRKSGINTTVVLTCSPSAVWSSQNLTSIFHAEKNGPCQVLNSVLISICYNYNIIMSSNIIIILYILCSTHSFYHTVELVYQSFPMLLSHLRLHTQR